jgi:hypothetical protein
MLKLETKSEKVSALAEILPLSVSLSHREERDGYTLDLRKRVAAHLWMLRANGLAYETRQIWKDLESVRKFTVNF